ncbi:MAG: SusD/RagB family nutrient-binding outer membrane lipoprotein, partial [Tannerella sp.]|nr:SusD/RagB family nutrient-binding outer membrane lipoprotein [Tannerella sp.]
MKKIIYILVTFSLFVTFTGCSDDDYSSKYLDPSKVTSVSIPNLMNGTFMRMRDYSTYGYYRFFAFDPIFVGKFAQSFGHGVGADMYESGYSGYTEGQFGSVYTTMMDYKMLVSLYEEASDEDKKNFESFKLATEVHYFDFLLAAVDLYGDMPYSEACRLPLEKDLAVAQPVYDKAEDIYSDVLDKLKVCAERFNSSDLVQYGNFSTQDFICMGDFNKWARYANSVRLRAALRISEYGSLAEKGKSIIAEIVGNPGQYPLIETNDKNVFLRNDHTGELNLRPGGFDWVSCRRASGAIVDRMLSKGNYRAVDSKYVEGTGTYVEGVDDPRILLLYSMRGIAEAKDGKVTTYRGAQDFCYPDVQKGVTTESSINPIFDDGKPVTLFFSGVDVGATVDDVSYYDDGGISEVVQDGFFWNNGNFEHVQMTASEVLFAKAEA